MENKEKNIEETELENGFNSEQPVDNKDDVNRDNTTSDNSASDDSAFDSQATPAAGEEAEENVKESKGMFSKKKDKNVKKMEALLHDKEKAEAEKAEIHDKYLRLYSEFDNYRRRTQKEKLDIIKNASENIILGILPVLDDMERALKYEKSCEEPAEGSTQDKEGFSLIYQKLKNFLKQQGLEEIVAVGEPFNVDLHEAVTAMPAPSEEEKGKILDEIQKGYKLNDKVIRFSKVVIFQ